MKSSRMTWREPAATWRNASARSTRSSPRRLGWKLRPSEWRWVHTRSPRSTTPSSTRMRTTSPRTRSDFITTSTSWRSSSSSCSSSLNRAVRRRRTSSTAEASSRNRTASRWQVRSIAWRRCWRISGWWRPMPIPTDVGPCRGPFRLRQDPSSSFRTCSWTSGIRGKSCPSSSFIGCNPTFEHSALLYSTRRQLITQLRVGMGMLERRERERVAIWGHPRTAPQ
mmetsp:Transcript_24727/g.68844  ORF Transcript_24727/g.68844 Transcript_24727/m.68844 type:complete len:224 (+) Transcript_24727:279-950(+)